MNATPTTNSHRDGIVTAIGVLALLIGTATGNAIAMLVIALVALAVMSIIYRHKIGRKTLLALIVAALTGIAVSMVVVKL